MLNALTTKEAKKKKRKNNKAGRRKLLELVAKFMVLIVMIVSWVWDTYLQTHYVCIITIYSFLYVNHTSMKWLKKETTQ